MVSCQKDWVNHPLLVPNLVERRIYQENIAQKAKKRNTLVVLPTALGKTTIAILVAIQRLSQYPWGKILVLAPTRPLVVQHYKTFRKLLNLPEEKFALITGRVTGPRRRFAYCQAQIIFSTPQVVANDLESGRIGLEKAVLVVFDEAHKARKNYAYSKIAEKYLATNLDPLILGLTASPGKDSERIHTLLSKLYIEQVEFRADNSLDVREYINPIDLNCERVSLPLMYDEAIRLIDETLGNWSEVFYRHNLLEPKPYFSKMAFLELAEQISILLSSTTNKFQKMSILKWMMLAGSCISLIHARELLVAHGVQVFSIFLRKLREKAANGKKSATNLLSDNNFQVVMDLAAKGLIPEHPKIACLQKIVKDQLLANPSSRIIIFAQYRQTVKIIVDHLSPFCKPQRFVGQASNVEDPGMCQDHQQDALSQFKQGDYNVLVATSVAEEGLDIPEVDLVIFFEAVPSEIRLIQRRGRTGRKAPGKCVILATANTFDERFLEISFKREGMMLDTLREIVQTEDLPQFPRVPLQPPPEKKSPLTYSEFLANERENRSKQERSKYENLLQLIGNSTQNDNPLFKTLTRKVEFLKTKQQILQKFRSKAGRFVAMTLASVSLDGISYDELASLAKLEEYETEQIDYELKIALKNKVVELLPGNVYRITGLLLQDCK